MNRSLLTRVTHHLPFPTQPGRYLISVMCQLTHTLTIVIAASLIKMVQRGRYDMQGCASRKRVTPGVGSLSGVEGCLGYSG